MPTEPVPPKPKRDRSKQLFAIVVERVVKLQHVIQIPASDMEEAVDKAMSAVKTFEDDEFDWRQDSYDAWSVFRNHE
jgi:hypothetical protein